MINLKKLFRRKKGQGALEYLFMIAAALIIIFVVVRYISGTGSQASSQVAIASLQSQAELAKTNLQARGWWQNDYTVAFNVTNDNKYYLNITNITKAVDITNSDYLDDIKAVYNPSSGSGEDIATLGTLYSECINDANRTACVVLAALGTS